MIDFLDFLEYAVVGGDGMPRKKPPVTVRGVTKDPEKKTMSFSQPILPSVIPKEMAFGIFATFLQKNA